MANDRLMIEQEVEPKKKKKKSTQILHYSIRIF
jgi:hypothetical protein